MRKIKTAVDVAVDGSVGWGSVCWPIGLYSPCTAHQQWDCHLPLMERWRLDTSRIYRSVGFCNRIWWWWVFLCFSVSSVWLMLIGFNDNIKIKSRMKNCQQKQRTQKRHPANGLGLLMARTKKEKINYKFMLGGRWVTTSAGGVGDGKETPFDTPNEGALRNDENKSNFIFGRISLQMTTNLYSLNGNSGCATFERRRDVESFGKFSLAAAVWVDIDVSQAFSGHAHPRTRWFMIKTCVLETRTRFYWPPQPPPVHMADLRAISGSWTTLRVTSIN